MIFTISELSNIAREIQKGKIGIISCDTILGLVGLGTPKNHERLSKIKQRPSDKPFLFLISNWSQFTQLASPDLPHSTLAYIESVWPGPTTVLVPKNKSIPDCLTGNTDTIGIRFVDYIPVQWLISYIGSPILSTSINMTSHPEITNPEEIPRRIKNQVDFIWTPFKAYYKKPSKIINLTEEMPDIVRS